MPSVIITKPTSDYTFRREGTRVLIFRDGELACDWPLAMIDAAIAELRKLALLSAEEAEKERIARDSAILLRAGAPLVLSARPDIQDEAVKMAAHDRDLRRYMPSIKSQESFGAPIFEHHPPTRTP